VKSSRGVESQRVLPRGGGLPLSFLQAFLLAPRAFTSSQEVRDQRASETLPYSVYITAMSGTLELLKADKTSPELVQGPPLLLGRPGALRSIHFKTEGKALQSLFERGLWRYARCQGMSRLRGNRLSSSAFLRNVGTNTEVFGHAVDRATEEVGQRIALVTQMSRKIPKKADYLCWMIFSEFYFSSQ